MYRTISGTQINLVCAHLLAAQRQNLLEYLAILLTWAAVRQQAGDSHRDTQTVIETHRLSSCVNINELNANVLAVLC